MITYYTTDSNIFYTKATGNITIEDFKEYFEELEKIDFPFNNLIALADFRDAKMKINILQLINVAKLAKKLLVKFEHVKTAVLVNKPNTTAYSLLFDKENSNSKTERKIFSTEEAAFDWLGDKKHNNNW